jgi:plasmid stabilization system protein ParE
MANGYEVFWTDHALAELESTYEYLIRNFSEKELQYLSVEIDNTIFLIAKNPFAFQISLQQANVRKVVVMKYNTIYYRIKDMRIEILSFFSNRQDPDKVSL